MCEYQSMDEYLKALKEKGWKKLTEELPPFYATDSKNAYISKDVLFTFEIEGFSEYSIGCLFLQWDNIPFIRLADEEKLCGDEDLGFYDAWWKPID